MPKKSAHRKPSKSRSKTGFAILVLVVIILIIILGQAVNLTKNLFRPYPWDGGSNINLVVKGEQVALLSYNPNEQKITVVDVPDETYISVPGDFGSWQLRSIYGLGQAQDGRGNYLLERSISSFFAIPVDGYISLKTSQPKSSKETVEMLRQNPLQKLTALGLIETDLSPIELVRLMLKVSKVRFDKVFFLDLKQMDLVEQENLADGSLIYSADPIKIDSLAQYFTESKILSERVTIGIYNSTSYAGLAQKAARIVGNIGGNVIIATNASQKRSNSKVISKTSSETYKKLMSIFEMDCNKGLECDTIAVDSEVEDSRAQINIILGEDFYQRF